MARNARKKFPEQPARPHDDKTQRRKYAKERPPAPYERTRKRLVPDSAKTKNRNDDDRTRNGRRPDPERQKLPRRRCWSTGALSGSFKIPTGGKNYPRARANGAFPRTPTIARSCCHRLAPHHDRRRRRSAAPPRHFAEIPKSGFSFFFARNFPRFFSQKFPRNFRARPLTPRCSPRPSPTTPHKSSAPRRPRRRWPRARPAETLDMTRGSTVDKGA